MTTTSQQVPVRTHVITGERDQVCSALQRARLDGRLVEITEARVLGGDRVRVVTRLRVPRPARSRWRRVRPWLAGAAKVLGVLAALAAVAGLVWAVVWAVMAVVALVTALIAWVQAHLLGIGLGVAAVVIGLLAASSGGHRCAGMHCGGCRR